jgi:hypothetical protein
MDSRYVTQTRMTSSILGLGKRCKIPDLYPPQPGINTPPNTPGIAARHLLRYHHH